MEEYNNRKAMLNTYYIDLTIDNEQAFDTQVIELLHNLDYQVIKWIRIEPAALSYGKYGVNGAVLDIMDEYTGMECATIAISGRTIELLKRSSGVTKL